MNNIYIDELKVNKCYIDEQKILKIYLDSTLIWQSSDYTTNSNLTGKFWIDTDEKIEI